MGNEAGTTGLVGLRGFSFGFAAFGDFIRLALPHPQHHQFLSGKHFCGNTMCVCARSKKATGVGGRGSPPPPVMFEEAMIQRVRQSLSKNLNTSWVSVFALAFT